MGLTPIRAFTRIPARAPSTTQASPSSRWLFDLADCPTCRGIGRVYRASGQAIWCPACGARRVGEELQRLTPLKGRIFEAARFDALTPVTGEETMLTHAARYAQAPTGWFVVQGGSGNAKTFALAAMRNVCRARGLGVYYVSALDLSALLFRCLSNSDDQLDLERFVARLRVVDVLMIDEFVKAKWKVDFIFEQLFRIVNARYEDDGLPLCVAFNEFAPIPDNVLSRLKDGRWSPDGQSDGIIVNSAADQRPYLPSLWQGRTDAA